MVLSALMINGEVRHEFTVVPCSFAESAVSATFAE
jgi:hypothetical protein